MNPSQHSAVYHEGNLAILAGPGSGKTFTIVERAKHSLEDPNVVVGMVSFTNAAADEMKERLGTVSGNRVYTGTFHFLAKLQLLAAGHTIELVSKGEKKTLAKRAANSVGESGVDLDEIESLIDAHKTLHHHNRPRIGKDLYQAYQKLLRENDKHDFGDLIKIAVEGMTNGTIAPLPVSHLTIDEYQDADPLQHKWAMLHAQHGIEVTVVADDDQSIYGWRHAMGYKALQSFIKEASAKTIQLDTCYRCHEEILSLAYVIVSENQERIPKTVRAHRGNGGWCDLKAFQNPADEIDELIQTVRRHPGEWAILCRSNQQLLELQQELMIGGIPYITLGNKDSMLDQPCVSVFLDVVTSLSQKTTYGVEQLLSWSNIAEDDIRAEKAFLQELMSTPGQKTSQPAHNSKHIKILEQTIAEWVALLHQRLPTSNELVIYGVKDWMMKQADKSEKGLIEAVAKMLVNTPGKPLHERVQHIKRLNMAKKTTSQDSGVLTLSTIHAAKGLEWERVWIPFCNQDMLPNKKANLSEERRLMFVAMTRAIRQLVISANHYKKSEFFTQLVGHISVEKVPDKNFMSSTVLD